jgi:phenylalanyl-tRNA synthetase beta chain
MLISLNWLKDFVEIPSGLDPRELALKFTLTTAEVEGVEHFRPNFSGLVAARIESADRVAGEEKLQRVRLTADKTYETLSAAPELSPGQLVIYGPPGAKVAGHAFATKDPAGRPSAGMIVAGQALGLVQVGASAMFLPPRTVPGNPIDPALFYDWIIEIDNKSITHRPDCWGHYGIAREIAAMLGLPLAKYDVTDLAALDASGLPEIPIEIDDPAKCPRYTGLLMKGLSAQPAPLWMQTRLAMCGQRPIDLLVDLTNYVMLELGQPMHAFDGEKLSNIQVAAAAPNEKFTTLDGVTRTMPPDTLMIQCNRRSVAIAGVMGGAETEVSPATRTVLLESANFDAATIRRAATAMGHRTEASARFEKSLDPANTVLGIARFHQLAMDELPDLKIASALSDCYPAPTKPATIELDCDFAARFIGKAVSPDEIVRILDALEFTCRRDGSRLSVTPPSYRATKDIEIEADLIEEVARFVGYNNIEPVLPEVTTRHFEPSSELALERQTLDFLCLGGEYFEVHNYIWYDDDWLRTLGYEPGPCVTLRNPAAEPCSRLRRSLLPGLLAMAERNRHHLPRFALAEIGSVFASGVEKIESAQQRNLGLLVARPGAKADAAAWDDLRTALAGWTQQLLEASPDFREAAPDKPWEDPDRTAGIFLEGQSIGRMTILPLSCKQRIDERLRAVSFALAEVDLTACIPFLNRHEKLSALPRFPRVQLDFSVLTDANRRYRGIAEELAAFKHPRMTRLEFVESYSGGAIPAGQRSLLFRAEIGDDDATLTDDQITDFRTRFADFLASKGLTLRT